MNFLIMAFHVYMYIDSYLKIYIYRHGQSEAAVIF